MSLTLTSVTNLRTRSALDVRGLSAPRVMVLVLLAALGAVSADQFATPVLYTSSPLWALAACLALVCRRGGVSFRSDKNHPLHGLESASEPNTSVEGFGFSSGRIALFAAAHVLLVIVARLSQNTTTPIAGTFSVAGWFMAGLKLSVLAPTVLLLPMRQWRILSSVYFAEGVAALVVLFTFFPDRAVASFWPWYGQMLGRLVFVFSGIFAHGLTYTSALTPTIHGPSLNVTILLACSGISGVNLFDYLFGFIALLDWNRLRKGRTLAAYLGGIAAMLLGNALRIASFVILGNRGFADTVARFHLSAGWFFFSSVFLVYLSIVYRELLQPAAVAKK